MLLLHQFLEYGDHHLHDLLDLSHESLLVLVLHLDLDDALLLLVDEWVMLALFRDASVRLLHAPGALGGRRGRAWGSVGARGLGCGQGWGLGRGRGAWRPGDLGVWGGALGGPGV